MKVLPEKINDVIWIATGFIGDVVLTTAGSQLLAKKFPDCRQHVVTTGVGAQALACSDDFASVTVFDKRKKGLKAFVDVKERLRQNISDPNQTLTLQAHRSFRSSLLAKYLAFPTITYHESDLSWLARIRVNRVALFHEAARISLLLEPLGIDRVEILKAKPRLRFDQANQIVTDYLVPQNEAKAVIAVAPGSVWGTKRWTESGFTELCRRLIKDDFAVVLIGSPAEAEVATNIERQLKGDRLINLVGKTKLTDLPSVLHSCAALVSNDSSPIHFASAVNTPTLALFGATVPEMGFGPLADGSKAVGISLDCRPCSDHGPMTCPLGHFKCMRDLSVDLVYESFSEIMRHQSAFK